MVDAWLMILMRYTPSRRVPIFRHRVHAQILQELQKMKIKSKIQPADCRLMNVRLRSEISKGNIKGTRQEKQKECPEFTKSSILSCNQMS